MGSFQNTKSHNTSERTGMRSGGPPVLLAFFLICVPCAGQARTSAIPDFDWGFLASGDATPDGNGRFRSLGPVFERQTATNSITYLAVRPFYSGIAQPSEEKSLGEFLWPVGMWKDHHNETYWRFVSAFGHDFDNANPDSRHRFLIFPILFSGKDKNQEDYFAIFPFGGIINEFLWQDRIAFAMFPLYTHTTVNDLETYDILWPFVSWARGNGKSKFRVLPFYARSVNEGRWVKQSIMWPIWTSADYVHPDAKGGGFILFPFCGHTKLTDQESWMLLPPFFRWSTGKNLKEVHCPWPFFQLSSGETDRLYFWPLWGMKETKGMNSWFLLANLIGNQQIDRDDYELRRFIMFPLIYNESRTAKDRGRKTDDRIQKSEISDIESGTVAADGQPATHNPQPTNVPFARYFKLWPIMSYERDGAAIRWKALDLWPTKGMAPVERNLAPFWTIYSHTQTESLKEDEVLWGLLRYRRDNDEGKYVSLFPVFSYGTSGNDNMVREWSFLKGLLGYRREGDAKNSNGLRREIRVLYLPIRLFR